VKDILRQSSCFEPVNESFIVFFIDPSISLDFEIVIGGGIGFVVGDQQKDFPKGEGFIGIDSIFTPVENVRINIEEESSFEVLQLFVTTDGRITPRKAIEEASSILVTSFSLLLNNCDCKIIQTEHESIFTVNDSVFDMHKLLMTPICDSNVSLSVRACNCLKSANIFTLGDLVSKTEEELMELKNFGKKSLKELRTLVENNNLKFGIDLSEFKIYKNK
ncbi:MAG: DNA-directed RNA polymerase subunit alpha, partial [Cytophagales bacterium]|nr:DNA-directed RNA polymerase subunit alpha [Cytophagales bacterium]